MSRTMAICVVLLAAASAATAGERAWKRHVIDRSSRGADGVRLADVNGDGRMDLATGWEQGGVVRVCIHPGKERVRGPWPSVTVGRVGSPEDAVFADLDGDGAMDVVSCCEGRTRTVFIHWAPRDRGKYLDGQAWRTQAIPVTAGRFQWMFALPMQIDGKGGIDLVVGSKNGGAGSLGWLQSPANPRDAAAWKYHPLYDAGWIMSLEAADMDSDGDADVLVSDRKGRNRGVLWLENPGPGKAAGPWRQHRLPESRTEVMFLSVVDFDGDRMKDVLCATRRGAILFFRRMSEDGRRWQTRRIANPPATPAGKAVRAADMNLDGRLDIVATFNTAAARKPGARPAGCALMTRRPDAADGDWDVVDVSGGEGVKFDLIQLLDLDGDGDLDVITCEEARNLGVFWYENPTK
jgi:hypothetical protein